MLSRCEITCTSSIKRSRVIFANILFSFCFVFHWSYRLWRLDLFPSSSIIFYLYILFFLLYSSATMPSIWVMRVNFRVQINNVSLWTGQRHLPNTFHPTRDQQMLTSTPPVVRRHHLWYDDTTCGTTISYAPWTLCNGTKLSFLLHFHVPYL